LDNRSDATQALILLFCQLFSVFVSCAIVVFSWEALARWADGKTYGRADFLGRLFCAGAYEITMYLAGRFLRFRWLSPAISAVCQLFIPLSIYKA
jgi:hypothetical protein